jgi:hypothetical protein
VIVASEANLRKIIEGAKGSGAPHYRISDTNASKALAYGAVDFAWVRDLVGPHIKAEKEVALSLSVIGPIWEKTDSFVFRIGVGDGDALNVRVDSLCADEEGAKRVEKTCEAFLTLAQNAGPEVLKMMRQQSKGEPIASELADLGEQALKTASVERTGASVRVQVSVKADVAKIVRALHGK